MSVKSTWAKAPNQSTNYYYLVQQIKPKTIINKRSAVSVRSSWFSIFDCITGWWSAWILTLNVYQHYTRTEFCVQRLTLSAASPHFSMAACPWLYIWVSRRVFSSPRPSWIRDTSWYIRPRSEVTQTCSWNVN